MVEKVWGKMAGMLNRETISYVFFGVLTTLVDWVSYKVYSLVLVDDVCFVLSSATAILFAFVTNKLFVFQSRRDSLGGLLREFTTFVSSRVAVLVATYFIWLGLVDGLGVDGFMAKVVTSAISLVGNYVFSKLLIFKK